MKYRNEIKYTINHNQATILKNRLKLLLSMDKYAYNDDGSYYIKSLYFDDIDNSAYYEKIDGVLFRSKYRIRTYNNNDSYIFLERKIKNDNKTGKEKCLISKDVYSKILNGKINEIETDNKLLEKFIVDMKIKRLSPSVVVGYKRTAFVYPISNVRITFDENVASGGKNYELFNSNGPSCKVLEPGLVVLEVKYDDILPKMIADIIGSIALGREAVSKFQKSRKIG